MSVVHDLRPLNLTLAGVLLTPALAVGVAAGYLVVWSVLGGPAGCGPPGHSAAGRIFSAIPFALPLAALAILLALGLKRRWRGATLIRVAVTTVVMSGILELLIFLVEFGAHHYGE